MRKTLLNLGLGVLLAAAPVAASGDDNLWLHVRVDGQRGESVSVNLPLSLVEKAIPMLPDEHFHGGDFVLDDVHWGHHHRLSVADLRELWNELQSTPDMTFVTFEEHDETVEVSKSGGYLLIDVDEHDDASVEVRVPLTVVGALLSGDGESLDIGAAIQAPGAHGAGELVAISEDDERVRVWIDARAAGD